jgi:hypothetical protein
MKRVLGRMKRTSSLLELPIDEARLRRDIACKHPALAARAAVTEIADAEGPRAPRPRFRRLAVLVVDDEVTTAIAFSAASREELADVALATRPIEAFEHVVSRPVDVLIVSATMRSDGGEPFYRVLWRLKPELKRGTVLITAAGAVPSSTLRTSPPRVLARPLTRDALRRIVGAFERA